MIVISVDKGISELCPGITLAYAIAYNLGHVDEIKLSSLIESTIEEVRRRYTLESLRSDPIVRAYRDFYWRYLKIDPTKIRPAAEALIRRVLRGRPFPRINPIVDIGNIISIKTGVCIGLYDVDKLLTSRLVLRRARKGEVFYPIGGRPRELSENSIVLAEDSRIIHEFPHRDSIHTAVDESTKRVLLVTCGVPGIDKKYIIETLELLKKTMKLLMNAECTESFVR